MRGRDCLIDVLFREKTDIEQRGASDSAVSISFTVFAMQPQEPKDESKCIIHPTQPSFRCTFKRHLLHIIPIFLSFYHHPLLPINNAIRHAFCTPSTPRPDSYQPNPHHTHSLLLSKTICTKPTPSQKNHTSLRTRISLSQLPNSLTPVQSSLTLSYSTNIGRAAPLGNTANQRSAEETPQVRARLPASGGM